MDKSMTGIQAAVNVGPLCNGTAQSAYAGGEGGGARDITSA